MKTNLNVSLACAVALACLAFPGISDDRVDAGRDHVRIDHVTAGGTRVTVVEGTHADATGEYVEATRVTTNTVRVPVQVVTNVVEVPLQGEPHKARLAVLPAVFARHFHPVFKFREQLQLSGQRDLTMIFTSAHESRLEAPSFTLSLVEAFVASRKFDVLERARLTEVLQEIDFGQSDYADAGNVVPMGRALNADYVVLPEVQTIHLVSEVKEIPYVDIVQPVLKGKMTMRLRVTDTATTRTVAAFTESVEVERRLRQNETFLDSAAHHLVLDLYAAASMRGLHRTLEAIYPVRLLDVEGRKVVLNRGEGAIRVGDEFEVFSLGRGYVDPDTGEVLGQSETLAGRVRVVRVLPRFSEAELLEGELGGELGRYLCRETASSIAAKTTVAPRRPQW